MASSSSYNYPCAACKFLRRKCMPDCVFSPYFPPEEPQKFANVHKIFGASNVSKLLNELPPHQRDDAVSSLAYEAEARVRDPVYGCVGAITFLQRQVERLQKEVDAANADLIHYASAAAAAAAAPQQRQRGAAGEYNNRRAGNEGNGGGGAFYQTPSGYALPYNNNNNNNNNYHPPWSGGGYYNPNGGNI